MAREHVQAKATSRDGTTIAYWRSGEGRPLVLVHGTTADHSRWQSVLALFEPHATVCAMDRRGRGGSGDAEVYDIEREYEDVAGVVDALAGRSGGTVDLFGHSYGAVCALEAVRLTPNVRKLVLYEPPFLFSADDYPPSLDDRLGTLLADGENEAVIETFFREVVRMPEDELALIRARPAWQARVAAAHTVVREERAAVTLQFNPTRYDALTVPTLLLQGSDSPPFLGDSTEAVAAALPDSRRAVLYGHQHVALDTAPQLVADAVVAFLAEP